jgi:hypothetical protein
MAVPPLVLKQKEVALAEPAAAAALDRGVLAVPEGRGDVRVFYADLPAQLLSGIHSTPVSALCVSWHPWPCLYTGAADGIARWSLEFVGAEGPLQEPLESLDTGWQRESEFASELLTGDLEKAPRHMALDGSGDRLVACVGLCTLIVSCCSGKVLARLEGHSASVTCAAFRTDHPDSVVTIAEDRRFIVYDLKAACILYGSCIVSSSPFISLATEAGGSRCAIGTSDGKVRLYDLATPDCRLLHTIDIPAATGMQHQPWLKPPQLQAGAACVRVRGCGVIVDRQVRASARITAARRTRQDRCPLSLVVRVSMRVCVRVCACAHAHAHVQCRRRGPGRPTPPCASSR